MVSSPVGAWTKPGILPPHGHISRFFDWEEGRGCHTGMQLRTVFSPSKAFANKQLGEQILLEAVAPRPGGWKHGR